MESNRHPAYYPFIGVMALAGSGALLVSIPHLVSGDVSPYWLALATITLITGIFPIKFPEIDYKISIEDAFLFTNLMLFGTEAGVVTAAIQGIMGSLRAKTNRRRLEFGLFNVGTLVISAYVGGIVFYHLYGRGPLLRNPPDTLGSLIVPIGALAVAHYLSNSFSVAVVIALDKRRVVFRVWKENLGWISVTCLAGVSVAALVAMNVRTFNVGIFIATAPIVLITYFTFRTYRDKVESHLRRLQELNALYLRTVESLALAVEAKDQTTYGHIRRVRAYALGLARLCGVEDKEELLAIETGSLLHDIGKLAVEDYILHKPGKLSDPEYERMKIHSVAGEEIIRQIRFPFPAGPNVRGHHERFDGKGYPDGLKAEAIPLGARILAIADVFDALRSPRPYKAARSVAEAAGVLRGEAGAQFDPRLVELFVQNIEALEAAAQEAAREAPELSFRKVEAEYNAPLTGEPITACLPGSGEAAAELIGLLEFCSGAGQAMRRQDALAQIERSLRRLLPFESCAVFGLCGGTTVQVIHAGGSIRERLEGLRLQLGKGIGGWVAAHNRPMLNTNPALEFQGLEHDLGGLSDTLSVPLRHEGSCVGAFSLYAAAPVEFTNAHLELFQAAAELVAPLVASRKDEAQPQAGDQALVDPVTGAWRARYLSLADAHLTRTGGIVPADLQLIYLRLANLSDIAGHYGSAVRDWALERAAKALMAEIRSNDVLTHFGQDSFVLLLAGIRQEHVGRRLESLREIIASIQIRGGCMLRCETASARCPEEGQNILTLLLAAQRSLSRQREAAAGMSAAKGARVVEFRAAAGAGVLLD